MTGKIKLTMLLAGTVGLLLGLGALFKPWSTAHTPTGSGISVTPNAGYQQYDSRHQPEEYQQIHEQIALLQRSNAKLEAQQLELLSELTELQNYYRQSHEEMQQLQKQLLAASSQTANTNSEMLVSSTNSKTNIDKVEEFNESLADKRLTVMDDALIEEDYDSSWSTAANDQIFSTANTGQFSGSSIIASECKSSLCVIDVSHEDYSSQQEFLDHFPMALGWEDSSGQYQIIHSDDEFLTRFYIARSGYDLPPDVN